MTVSRLFRVCLAALMVTAGSLLIGSSPAHAVAVDQTCAGTEVTSYNPPLTFTPQLVTITVSGVYPICTDREVFNGSYSETFTLTASCAVLLDSGSPTRTFLWGNPEAEPSTFRYNVTASDVGGQLVVTNTGVITDGKFAPAGAQQVITLATPNSAQCAGSGISNVTGPTTLIIYRT
jgi:hypothetical protein